MSLSQKTMQLLLSALGSPEARDDLVTDIDDSGVADGAVTTAKLADLAVTDAKVATGIDAVKLADGSVSNAEFQFLDGVTSGIQAQIDAKPEYQESGFNANFDHSIGLIAATVRKISKQITIEITTASTADGGGTVIASGVALDASYRPAADLSFPVIVTDNGVKVFGKLIVASAGTLTFSASAAGAGFTDDAVAGWDRVAVTYTLA